MTQTKAKVPLSVTHPDIASEWHPTKNGGLTPEQVLAGSNKKVWWICGEGPDHEWEASSHTRTGKGTTGCPCCSGNKLSVTNSLATLFPDVAAQWHFQKNDGVTPDQVVAGSNKKY